MCVLLVLSLMAIVWVYSNYLIGDYVLAETLAGQTVVVAESWALLPIIWPVALLFMLFGMFVLLVFLKLKKVI